MVLKYFLKFLSILKILSQSSGELPIIEIDSILISWGLLNGKYHINNTIDIKKLMKFHQWFAVGFMITTIIQFTIYMSFEDNSQEDYKYGDVIWFYGPRKYLLITFIIYTINMYAMLMLFMIGKRRLLWLRVMEFCKKQLSAYDIGMDDESAYKFHKRVYITSVINNFFIVLYNIILIIILMTALMILQPKGWFIIGLAEALYIIICFYYVIINALSIIIIFYHLCYYFKLRFKSINLMIKTLSKLNIRNHKLIIDKLNDYESICLLLYFNYFHNLLGHFNNDVIYCISIKCSTINQIFYDDIHC